MNNRQSYVLTAYRRTQNFVDVNAATLGSIPQSTPKKTLDDVVTTLSGHATNQDTAFRQRVGATNQQSTLRKALLVNHMRPIAEIAKDRVASTPEVNALTMPSPKLNVERLVAAANSMAAAATPFAQAFIDDGLPADFLAQLTAAATALTSQATIKSSSQTIRVQATTGVASEIRRGRRAVNILDSFIVPALAGNDTLLAGWRNAKRVAPQTAPAPVSPTPPVTPAPTASVSHQGAAATSATPAKPTAPAKPVAAPSVGATPATEVHTA